MNDEYFANSRAKLLAAGMISAGSYLIRNAPDGQRKAEEICSSVTENSKTLVEVLEEINLEKIDAASLAPLVEKIIGLFPKVIFEYSTDEGVAIDVPKMRSALGQLASVLSDIGLDESIVRRYEDIAQKSYVKRSEYHADPEGEARVKGRERTAEEFAKYPAIYDRTELEKHNYAFYLDRYKEADDKTIILETENLAKNIAELCIRCYPSSCISLDCSKLLAQDAIYENDVGRKLYLSNWRNYDPTLTDEEGMRLMALERKGEKRAAEGRKYFSFWDRLFSKKYVEHLQRMHKVMHYELII